MKDLLEALSGDDVQYLFVADDSQNFKSLFLQTENQKRLFNRFGEMLQLDSTYKVLTIMFITCGV